MTRLLYLALFLSVFTQACKDDDPSLLDPLGKGVFIANEGPFFNGNGSLSFVSFDTDSIQNDIFETQNARPLGNVVQSVHVHDDDFAFIVVNNAGRVEVIDPRDAKYIGAVTDLDLPRYAKADASRMYITQWGDGFNGSLAVADLASRSVLAEYPLGSGPEDLLLHDDRLFIPNSGGYGTDSTVHVFTLSNLAVRSIWTVDYNPKSIVATPAGEYWVLCAGKKTYDPVTYQFIPAQSTAGSLMRLSATGQVLNRFEFSNIESAPKALQYHEASNSLYFLYESNLYSMSATATTLPGSPFITGPFYAFGLNPANGELWLSEEEYVSEARVFRYSNAGSLLRSYTAGIIPGGFGFKN
jgi:hypothetical protein